MDTRPMDIKVALRRKRNGPKECQCNRCFNREPSRYRRTFVGNGMRETFEFQASKRSPVVVVGPVTELNWGTEHAVNARAGRVLRMLRRTGASMSPANLKQVATYIDSGMGRDHLADRAAWLQQRMRRGDGPDVQGRKEWLRRMYPAIYGGTFYHYGPDRGAGYPWPGEAGFRRTWHSWE